MFIRRMQSLGFSKSLLTMLLAEVGARVLLEDIRGFLTKILSIVVNWNKATHILGLQSNC